MFLWLWLQPVVPFSVREARSDVVIPREICKPPHDGNYVIRKGDRCVIHQFTVSKLDRFYSEPTEYDPTRFLEKGVRTFSQGVYPFFNQNPRLCLGRDFALMEAKVFMVHFRTFRCPRSLSLSLLRSLRWPLLVEQ